MVTDLPEVTLGAELILLESLCETEELSKAQEQPIADDIQRLAIAEMRALRETLAKPKRRAIAVSLHNLRAIFQALKALETQAQFEHWKDAARPVVEHLKNKVKQ